MFRWLANVVYGPGHSEFIEALNQYAVGPNYSNEYNDWLRDFQKKERLERELENAEWILDYEKRLARLQKKTAAQRSKAEQAAVNTERLRRLEHHLAGLRRNLSRD